MNIDTYLKLLDDNTEQTLALAIQLPAPLPLLKVDTGWTGIQILEHIYLTDKVVSEFIFQAPKGLAPTLHFIGQDELKRRLILEIQPVQAPPAVIPSGSISGIAQFNVEFKALRDRLKYRLLTETALPINRYYHTALMGDLTVMDWLFFILYHTERHLNQLKKL